MTGMPFMSARGCCARCRKVVSCRARNELEAVGSHPYRHKVRCGDPQWCDGHLYPALHFLESADEQAIKDILLVDRQHAEMVKKRRREGR